MYAKIPDPYEEQKLYQIVSRHQYIDNAVR